MGDQLENLIRAWCRADGQPAAPPAAPTAECLTFAQARDFAAGSEPQLAGHVLSCPRCRKLVEDFQEALAEEAPGHVNVAAHTATTAPRPIIHRLVRPVPLAIAATLLLAVGVGILVWMHQPAEPLLASADLGPKGLVEHGWTAKGPLVFATDEQIALRVSLRRPGHVRPEGPPGTRVHATWQLSYSVACRLS